MLFLPTSPSGQLRRGAAHANEKSQQPNADNEVSPGMLILNNPLACSFYQLVLQASCVEELHDSTDANE